jgi:methylated-DNA-[protein]-cysteine S-methyltransferase
MQTYIDNFMTPLGVMEIRASEQRVLSIYFVETAQYVMANTVTAKTKQQLKEYFAGQRTEFDLPLGSEGTVFQQEVWRALISVPYGKTCSYGDIAKRIDRPRAVRAVGAANGKNPLTIVVPCHRIIGSDGSLTGYASGITRKAWLLNHESSNSLITTQAS